MDKLLPRLKNLLATTSRLALDDRRHQKAAEEKLAMFRNKIGYPEKWRDYSSIKVSRTALVKHGARDVYERDYIQQAGQAVDEKEWT